jgi:hypothetical protein
MAAIENKKPGLQFFATWVLFSIVSGVVAFVVYLLIMKIYNAFVGSWIVVNGEIHIVEDFLLPYILWPIYGLLYGYLQYILLRRYFPRMGWWILATALSLSLTSLIMDMGWSIASVLGIDPYSMWLVAIQLVLVGGFLGIAQWLVLRKHISNAMWWIPANMVGWGLVGISGVLGVFTTLVYPAVITGLALYLLLETPQVKTSE